MHDKYMMGYRIMARPFSENGTAELMVLDYYQSEMEGLLGQRKEDLASKIQKISGGKIPIDSFMSVWTHDFPRYLRYSFVVLLVSFAEDKLSALCVDIGGHQPLDEGQVTDKLKEIRKNKRIGKIESTKFFLEESLGGLFSSGTLPSFRKGIRELYEPVLFMVKVRNCIVHDSGNISELEPEKRRTELLGGIGLFPGFDIREEVIVLEGEFCKNCLQSVNDLLISMVQVARSMS
ncbi:MAG: hypothetical protein ACYC7J_05070 [Syntrophales bacterium]